jgi:hypothetical protein
MGDVVEAVRTVFEEKGDVTLYIPSFLVENKMCVLKV